MGEHQIERGVAARLAMSALGGKGELRRTVFVDQAIRGALMIDLCLLGLIGLDEDQVWVDSSATGYRPADLLFAQMDAQPGLPLDHWMVKGVASLRMMADQLVDAGVWRLQRSVFGSRRFECVDASWARDSSYSERVAGSLAFEVGLIYSGDSAVVDGPAAWLHQAVLDLLAATMVNSVPTGGFGGGATPGF